jgi:hypothetical protein
MDELEKTDGGMISASIGQQVFTISSGIAGGLAGMVLATRLTGKTHVHMRGLLAASAISAIATFAAVYLIHSEFVNPTVTYE